MEVITEGVETSQQLTDAYTDGLQDVYQGYYFSRPVPEEEFEKNIISDSDFKNDIVDILCNIGCFVMQSNFLFMRNPVTNFMEQLMTESSCF